MLTAWVIAHCPLCYTALRGNDPGSGMVQRTKCGGCGAEFNIVPLVVDGSCLGVRVYMIHKADV